MGCGLADCVNGLSCLLLLFLLFIGLVLDVADAVAYHGAIAPASVGVERSLFRCFFLMVPFVYRSASCVAG